MKRAFWVLTLICIFFSIHLQGVNSKAPFGIVVNNNTNSIQFIDPGTQTLSESYLKGSLGSYIGGLYGVAITSDGKTAIVSNYYDSKIFFIDISGGLDEDPVLLGSADVGLYPEDIAITPDNKYALVTDGAFSNYVSVVNIEQRYLSHFVDLGGAAAESVAITPDGKTVLFTDYLGNQVHSFSLSSNGHLTHKQTLTLNACYPVNLTISPDGKTAIVVSSTRYDFPLLDIYEDGTIGLNRFVKVPSRAGQSCVFSQDGKKAYYYSNPILGAPRIHVFDVYGPGNIEYKSSIILSIPRSLFQTYGINSMAIEPSGNYLYVSNTAVGNGVVEISVIDLNTEAESGLLYANGIPIGIAFTVIQ